MKQEIVKKGFGKTIILILMALAMIAACAFLFSGLSQGVMAAEMKKSNMVSTNYGTTAFGKNLLPDGYTKTNYTVETDLNSNIPTAKDMTREDAAEIGAQLIWRFFEADLKDATIVMQYIAATESSPRSTWYGEVRFGKSEDPMLVVATYSFQIDAVTGEWSAIHSLRDMIGVKLPILPENAAKFEKGELSESVAKRDLPYLPDPSLTSKAPEYEMLAKQMEKKYNLVGGEVKSVETAGQGVIDGDPSIVISVTGTNDEHVSYAFSRYDKKLIGIYQ